ncbi:hypothetical protein DFS33DRAFT_1398311 [Desarmillaria ectypa]|nr:hypothetical protein DFS33DRAFT_1398311 [Desarmillaria ectypa]
MRVRTKFSHYGHGYPLWLPQPISNIHPDCVRRGTQLGDLGHLSYDGGFTYLFNVCKDAMDPVNLNRAPPGFTPLTSIPGVREDLAVHKRNTVISSSAAEQRRVVSGFEFTSSREAAVLVLPDGAELYDSEQPSLFEEYAIANAHSWCKHFNGPEQGARFLNALINEYIFDSYPDATVALTRDDHLWTGVPDKVQNPLDAIELAKYVIDNNLALINKGSRSHNAWIAKWRPSTKQDKLGSPFEVCRNDIPTPAIRIDQYQCKDRNKAAHPHSHASQSHKDLVREQRYHQGNVLLATRAHRHPRPPPPLPA